MNYTMTHEQILETFRSYPTTLKSSLLRKLMRDFEGDLIDESIENADRENRKLTVEEKLAIVENLSGIASIPGKRPPSDEEWREERTNYLLEKYK